MSVIDYKDYYERKGIELNALVAESRSGMAQENVVQLMAAASSSRQKLEDWMRIDTMESGAN